MKKIILSALVLCSLVATAYGEEKALPVQPSDTAPASAESLGLAKRLFLTLQTDRPSAQSGERIPIIVKLYVQKLNVTDIRVPTLYQNALSGARFGEPRQYREEIDGSTFDVLEFKAMIFGTQPGTYRIGPAVDSCNVVTKKISSTGDALYGAQPVELRSQDIEITIQAPSSSAPIKEVRAGAGNLDSSPAGQAPLPPGTNAVHAAARYIPFAVILAIIVAAGLFSQKKKIEALRALAGPLQGRVTALSFSPSFKGEHEGLKFCVRLTPQSKGSPPYLTITLSRESAFTLTIHNESDLSALGKKLGLVHEVQTGDALFDADFLILSNDPDRAIDYLSSAKTRSLIKEFFDDGFAPFSIGRKKVTVQKPSYQLEVDLEPQKMKALLWKLATLARSAP